VAQDGAHLARREIEDLLANPYINIEAGIFYIRLLLNLYPDYQLATVAYNMGSGWVRYRLRNGLMVGKKNMYLSKVQYAYSVLSQNFIHQVAQRFPQEHTYQISFNDRTP
ncbi:MAG: transglycosylase SLT domain-containing protein, partial [Pseudomonadota bacterium]